MLDFQASVVLAVLPLSHSLPVAPEPVLILGLVRFELSGERTVLEPRLDALQPRRMRGLLLCEPLFGLLLPHIQLCDPLLAVLIQAFQHGQGWHEISGTRRVQIELEATERRLPMLLKARCLIDLLGGVCAPGSILQAQQRRLLGRPLRSPEALIRRVLLKASTPQGCGRRGLCAFRLRHPGRLSLTAVTMKVPEHHSATLA
mmetsp:Transcript_1414/g.3177  ORF Transcript_1414/g.3177 Transcript_1414/m.3177 type:complete len:202 (-) Transcript_1414:113-718(-)